MIYNLFVLICLITYAFAMPSDMNKLKADLSEFKHWMKTHSKYYDAVEFKTRFATFRSNLRFIENFNGSFSVAMNQFGDLSPTEFRRIYLGLTPQVRTAGTQGTPISGLPSSVDWRQKGVVTAVKNQGQCGSCWSFSTTGSTEGAHALAGNSLVSLSEQQLVDCSSSYGNSGCNGGLMDYAFQYIIAVGGLESEYQYPYTAQDGTCQFESSEVVATISSYQDVTHTEAALQQASATYGPISVAIDASPQSFQFYSGGVYYEPGCSSTQLDHGVLVVGYSAQSGTPYWIVKNSWGASWGLNGYIWMARNRNNMCGIATMPSYPVV